MDRSNARVLRRPNGRLQACNPCHKRKLACDHTQPICNRCRKRKQGGECVYLVGPVSPASKRSTPGLASPSSPAPVESQEPSRTVQLTAPEVPTPNSTKTGTGYLGFTSYCGVFEETENSLYLLRGSERVSNQHSNDNQNSHDTSAPGSMSNRILDMCLTVLRSIPDPTKPEALTYIGPSGLSFMYSVARVILLSLHETFGQYFGATHHTHNLEDLARTLCINTARPLSDNELDSDSWMNQFTGPNTRWESLGVLFTFWDFAGGPKCLQRGGSPANRGRGSWASKESLKLCLDLCKELSPGNSLMLYLNQRYTIVESMSVGDANLSTWRYHAETVALLTFLGFHVPEEGSTYQPTFSSELKRRFFYHMYTMGMVIVSFTGRPPLISRRFISPPLPLDISDEDLLSSSETFKKAIKRLDDKGWNTDGVVHSCTHLRARAMIASIREEIFEIALSSAQIASVGTLLGLRARELQAKSEFPAILRYNPQDFENPRVDAKMLFMRLLVELEHLQNMFFIERLLLRHNNEDKGNLLAVSYEMVTLTLPFWTQLDRLSSWRVDCEWLVCTKSCSVFKLSDPFVYNC
ncbi:hypothetical protein F5B20DRAFT_532246 [Whalleya microplaca]|nr:hypothetical protein F5B20DRAFT_532246 [Whalleya microplaca]